MTTHTTERAPERRAPQLAGFRARCAESTERDLSDPQDFHRFSVEDPATFWRTLLDWSQLPWSGSAETVLTGPDVETARFFPDVRLNVAEALLRSLPGVDDDAPALTSVHADGTAERFSRRELRQAVERTAAALSARGTGAGDRVVAIAPNSATAVLAALGVVALGATLSTATPDMGAGALLGRLEAVEPVLLLIDRNGMSEATVAALLTGLPSLRQVLVLDDEPLPPSAVVTVERLDDVVRDHLARTGPQWPRLPFDHPLFVMFSSGTTGRPKAIVHGAGGTLLEHVKEHSLHGDLTADDTLYFHTTTAWMMWNWQLSALAVGAHVVVYDGPVLAPATLWTLVADHGVTVFGTSPAYLQLCEDEGYRPAEEVDLRRLRAVLSTGAVLHDWQFDWVAAAVGPQPLQSISGGTDILGCFVLGHPELPVRRGRCQSRSLGLDVAAVDGDGTEVVGGTGELVCRRPFPSRPIGFLADPDGSRFHEAYFSQHAGMWTHGDLIDIAADGTARLHGRSDGVLNIDGVRIGPSEIYTILRALPDIAEAMAVEQQDPGRPGQSRMVLLVVLRPGAVLDADLDSAIRRTLRREASAAHVPALVLAVPELPLTHNGKRSEAAARDAVNGETATNVDALRNPASLDAIRATVATASPEAVAAGPTHLVHSDATTSSDDATPVHPELARIWCEVLNVRAARPEDDFTDLGGTSRQVMQLLRKIWLEMGVDVPVTDVRHQTTLGSLARAIAVRSSSRESAGIPLLRPGTGRALYIVADLWGQLNSYDALIHDLTTERPVYGIQVQLADADGRRRTIDEVSEEALSLLRKAQSSGPYSLAGYSFGGLVAFETARRLRAAGETVSYLGLIDVRPPTGSLTRQELAVHRIGRLLKWLRTAVSRRLPAAMVELIRVNSTTGAADPERQAFVQSSTIFNAHRLSGYDGPVTYYLARRRLPVAGNSLSAWRRAVTHLLVTEVPGDHDDMLSRETIGALAARMSATLA